MKELQITGGVVLLDDEDYERIADLNWYVNRGYARNRFGYMHHRVLGSSAERRMGA